MATQAERRGRTRAALLDAAAAAFAERGYHGTTLDAVAERAGASKGAVYHHFASKHELFATLLTERIGARLGEARDAASTRDAGGAFLERAADPRWAPLFFEFVAQAARDDDVRALLATWLRDTRAALAGMVAERLGGPPDERTATLVSALSNGMMLELLIDPEVDAGLLGEGLELLARGAGASRATRPGA